MRAIALEHWHDRDKRHQGDDSQGNRDTNKNERAHNFISTFFETSAHPATNDLMRKGLSQAARTWSRTIVATAEQHHADQRCAVLRARLYERFEIRLHTNRKIHAPAGRTLGRVE